MESKYNPHVIERQAQEYWERTGAFRAEEQPSRPKYYCLSMFPYPSGKLHMGHVRNYTIGDVLTRYHRMKGCNVLQPMGWDAFGLPAENAAMQNAMPPARWTYDNIAYMKRQLVSLGFAIDWSRELATCRPEYYRWNQWLFLRMLEKGLVYKKTGVVNWDPLDQTVLANEQVIDGRGWRTGAVVEKREIPMYYMAITRYAEELLADLERLPDWPERVRTMQANWIGKSIGVRFAFPYELPPSAKDSGSSSSGDGKGLLWVFTTRADTIMGVTFVAVAAEHPLAQRAAKDNPALAAFVEECKRGSVMEADLATMEKKGMDTGLSVIHPLTNKKVPVWVGNYVLMGYGDGAVMGVPAHDERDFHFAKRYGLPIKQVIAPPTDVVAWEYPDVAKNSIVHRELRDAQSGEELENVATFDLEHWYHWYDTKNGVCVNSGKYDGMSYGVAVDAIAADLKAMGLGEKQVLWRLRDWGISRQRYWGTPIPIIHCAGCGDVPVPDDQLPVVLPEDCVPDGTGNPLNKRADFTDCTCPKCGKPARRETDTMDTFVDSSWYYMRYACPDGERMVDDRVRHWLPVDQYIGGIEHAILHLLYSRFWTKVMRDMGLVGFDEPFGRLLTQGMVLNHVFVRTDGKGRRTYFAPEELDILTDDAGRVNGARSRADGQPVPYEGISTMSKSSRNGVDPQELIEHYGADIARFFIIFTSPPEMTLMWSDTGVEGAARFLRRLWSFAHDHRARIEEESKRRNGSLSYSYPASSGALPGQLASGRREIHLNLKQANYDIERHQFNTVASGAMKILNALNTLPVAHDTPPTPEHSAIYQQLLHEGMSVLLRLLAPITPHVCHQLWRDLGLGENVMDAPWPEPDPAALIEDEIELVVQVNGKKRGDVRVPREADKKAIEELVLALPFVQKIIAGLSILKIVIVPGRLVNVVVSK